MTAQQAHATFARRLHVPQDKWGMPADVTVRLGLLTTPATRVLAYGYRWHSCYIPTLSKLPRPPVKSCHEWNFLNPRPATRSSTRTRSTIGPSTWAVLAARALQALQNLSAGSSEGPGR
jgi:hypothetical protein